MKMIDVEAILQRDFSTRESIIVGKKRTREIKAKSGKSEEN